METFNLHLFYLLNAGADLAGWSLYLAVFAADGLVFTLPLVLVARWLWGPPAQRATLLMAFCAITLALLANLLISLAWFHPRPFMVADAHVYLVRRADSSFPSDHATVMLTAAFVFLARPGTRSLGGVFLLLAGVVAWARVFLGVHFPLDMLGAVAIAAIAAGLVTSQAARITQAVQPAAESLYRKVFAPLIRRRWIRD